MPIQKGPANLGTGTIDAAELASGSVTTAKIADANVTSGKLASGAAVSNIGYTPANKAGDTFTGYVEVGNTVRVTSISNPASGSGMELAYDGTQGIIQTYSNRGALTSVPVYFVNGQIKFPATQVASADANTLDDYEEGTWTPQAWQGSTQITSPNVAYGRYIKIGNMIWIGMYFYKASGAPSASGQWQIRGLPFSVSAAQSGVNSVITGYLGVNGTPSTQTGRWQANSSTALDLYNQYGSTSWTSSYIEFSFSGCLEAG